ncbi:hypothetical protein [uncultured Methylobacterium sp.]|uniref:hypothetical protein n=1 Tax=uncultured Methylobacterium sp. TaxID=157278 RepID=UPI0035CBB5F6
MTETGTPSPREDDERVANEARTKSLQNAGNAAEKKIEQDSSASEAIDRATAAVGKDED